MTRHRKKNRAVPRRWLEEPPSEWAPHDLDEKNARALHRARLHKTDPVERARAIVFDGAEPAWHIARERAIDSALVRVPDCDDAKGALFEVVAALLRRNLEVDADLVANLVHVRGHWVRTPDSWRPKTRSRPRLRRALVDHLLVGSWPVSEVLYGVWDAEEPDHAPLFLLAAEGRSFKNAPGLPRELTRKRLHILLTMKPLAKDIGKAFTEAVCRDLGADRRTIEAVLAVPFADMASRTDEANSFWTSVWAFFVAHPMLDRVHYGPICDYLERMKFGDADVAPEQPGLAMKGRSPAALLRAVRGWHRRLHRVRGTEMRWGPHGACLDRARKRGWFEAHRGKKHDRVAWTCVELLSSTELADEGYALGHCVASYAYSCARGDCSIWSLRRDGYRRVTIEVTRNGVIVQARGRHNDYARNSELGVIAEWAAAAGFGVSL